LPSVGIFIIVTIAALELAGRWQISGKVLGGLAIAVLLVCAGLMEKQLWHWQSSETLFRQALAVTADNDVARNNLGVALEQQNRLAEAAEQYRAAMRLAPDRFQGPHNLANVLDRLGRRDDLLPLRRAAVKIAPQVPFLQFALGRELKSAGQTNEALLAFTEAARLDAQYPLPHVEMARIYLEQGRDAEAIAELRAAVRIVPDSVEILTFTAQVLAASDNAASRDGKAALALATKANLLASGSRPATLDVLGMAYAETGQFGDAQLAAKDALEAAAALKLTGTEPIQRRLALYKQHQPWRESFRATNAPAKH
jgi:tetratricopeptide (TPR) repeat protein